MTGEPLVISPAAKALLLEISAQTGQPPNQVLTAALEAFQRAVAAQTPISVIPGVDPADVWEGAADAEAGRLYTHEEVFARLRSRK